MDSAPKPRFSSIPNLISAKDLAARLGIKTATLAKWRQLGRGPQGWIYLSATLVVYPLDEVEKFLAERAAHQATTLFAKSEQEDRP